MKWTLARVSYFLRFDYIKGLSENRKQSYDNSDQGDLVNESSTISGSHKTGREGVRPEAYPILWSGVAARSLIRKFTFRLKNEAPKIVLGDLKSK